MADEKPYTNNLTFQEGFAQGKLAGKKELVEQLIKADKYGHIIHVIPDKYPDSETFAGGYYEGAQDVIKWLKSQLSEEAGMNFIKEFGEECKELGMKVKKTKDGIEITPTDESMERLFSFMGAIPASRGEPKGEKR
jgi:hypothetical protein